MGVVLCAPRLDDSSGSAAGLSLGSSSRSARVLSIKMPDCKTLTDIASLQLPCTRFNRSTCESHRVGRTPCRLSHADGVCRRSFGGEPCTITSAAAIGFHSDGNADADMLADWNATSNAYTQQAFSGPTQIFSLFKLLSYPVLAGNQHGDGMDEAFTRVDPRGRSIIDAGLHDCKALVAAVRRGFVVHGFEPVPEHMANCRRHLRPTEYVDVDVASPASLAAARLRRLAHNASGGEGLGLLYLAAVGNATRTALMRFGGASSTLASRPVRSRTLGSKVESKEDHQHSVHVVRIDEVVRESVWLLKLDVQGFEWHALDGASRLFRDFPVAHVMTEYTPRLLVAAGVAPRALVDTLKRYGMVCFDVRNGDGARTDGRVDGVAAPWALGRDHPLAAGDYLGAMADNDERGAKQDELGRGRSANWMKYGSFDDLVCVNVAKTWP